jgi:hypothetical protein
VKVKAVAATIVACVLVVAAGCGSSNAQQPTVASSKTTTQTRALTVTALRAGIRNAVRAQHRLLARVLWANTVPAHPAVIGGPALKNLRSAAATRRKRQIRVKLLAETFRIVAIRLDPSYATASATVSDRQKLRPYNYAGKPLGNAISDTEHAKITLHRIGRSYRFLVWMVTATK